MIIKGNNPAPFKVNKGMKGYNVWVYKNSTMPSDGIIRHKCWDIVALLSFLIVAGLPKVFS